METLAFGQSGLRPIQSYLICEEIMDFFDLDMVVYVFVENDIGDQIREIKRDTILPYAKLENGELTIDNSFRDSSRYRLKWYCRLFEFIRAKFLLITTLKERAELLVRHGIKERVTEEDRNMATKSMF